MLQILEITPAIVNVSNMKPIHFSDEIIASYDPLNHLQIPCQCHICTMISVACYDFLNLCKLDNTYIETEMQGYYYEYSN